MAKSMALVVLNNNLEYVNDDINRVNLLEEIIIRNMINKKAYIIR